LTTPSRIFFLYASKEEEREQWIKCIKAALGFQTVIPKMAEEVAPTNDEGPPAIDPGDEKYFSSVPYSSGFLNVRTYHLLPSFLPSPLQVS
jgi:hypothetical protein